MQGRPIFDELSIFELRSAMLDAEAELLRREAAMAMRRLEIAK
jgi:hypothetical protein